MKSANSVLKRMLLTEKSGGQSANLNQYSFEVFPTATKHTVADAVAKAFSVTVRRVNIINVKARPGRALRAGRILKPAHKKAVVTLKEGDKIELA